MTLLHRLASALRWIFRRGRLEQDLNDELQAFVDMAVADKIRDGASPAEARRVAMVDLGGVEPVKERVRTVRPGAWLDVVGRDVRYGLRQVRRNAAFSIFAILVLAIGIGANTAVFTVINAVLFRPLAFHDPERIVALASTWPARGTRSPDVSLPDFMDWQARAGSNLFTATAYYRKSRRAVLVDGAGSYAQTTRTSPGFFKVLGIAPVMGRTFMPDEDSGARSVVISHDFWRTQMNQSPSVLGKTLFMNDQNMKVIGVMPPGFTYPDESDLWYLTDAVKKEYEEPRGTISWFVLARLFALTSKRDAHHQRVVEVFGTFKGLRLSDHLLTTNRVIAETITLARKIGHAEAVRLGEQLYGEKLARAHWASPDEERAVDSDSRTVSSRGRVRCAPDEPPLGCQAARRSRQPLGARM